MKITILHQRANMHDYPNDWQKGELLNVCRYTNGQYRLTRLGDDASVEDLHAIEFGSTEDCQKFVSWWYTQEVSRGTA